MGPPRRSIPDSARWRPGLMRAVKRRRVWIEADRPRAYSFPYVRAVVVRERGVFALPQAARALRLRGDCADQEPDRGADPAAPAGAGPGARHRAAREPAALERRAQDRALLAEPLGGARTRPRRAGARSRRQAGG